MRVTNQLNNQHVKKQNFTSVNLIQVSRQAKEFNDLTPLQIETLFTRRARRAMTGLPNVAAVCLQALRRTQDAAEIFLETFYHARIIDLRNRIAQKTGEAADFSTLQPPKDKDYHSFYVYTEEQAAAFRRFAGSKPQEIQSANQAVRDELAPESLAIWLKNLGNVRTLGQRMKAAFYEKIDPIVRKQFEDISKGQDVHAFKIDDLSQLPQVFAQIRDRDNGKKAGGCLLSPARS